MINPCGYLGDAPSNRRDSRLESNNRGTLEESPATIRLLTTLLF